MTEQLKKKKIETDLEQIDEKIKTKRKELDDLEYQKSELLKSQFKVVYGVRAKKTGLVYYAERKCAEKRNKMLAIPDHIEIVKTDELEIKEILSIIY